MHVKHVSNVTYIIYPPFAQTHFWRHFLYWSTALTTSHPQRHFRRCITTPLSDNALSRWVC